MPATPPLPPVAAEPLSVVLLGSNAAPHLEAVVSGWVASLDGLGREYELILVEDGADSTADAAAGLGAALSERHPRLKVLPPPARGGEGAALRAALGVARHPLLFYTLCQPCYRPEDLGRLLTKHHPPRDQPEIDQVHLLSGYRAGTPVPWPWRVLGFLWRVFCRVDFGHAPPPLPGWLGWKGHAGRVLARVLFGIRYHDVACPCRLLRRSIFERIPLQSDGPFVHVEILAKANFLGHVMGEEVPLAVPPGLAGRPGGTFRELAAEFYRVLARPDFGPAEVTPAPSPGAAPPAGAEAASDPAAGPAPPPEAAAEGAGVPAAPAGPG